MITEIINAIDYESKLLITGTIIGIVIGWYFTRLYCKNKYTNGSSDEINSQQIKKDKENNGKE